MSRFRTTGGRCTTLEERADMNRFAFRTLCAAALVASSACGETPSDFPMPPEAPPAGNLQKVSFTGVAEPATGRFQVFMGPQAAFGTIPESADANANTVAANTVQVYGPTVSWVTNNTLYPAGCNRGAPMLMQANVEVFSGYSEQLRNVYANVSAMSSSPTACATNSLGSFAAAVGTTFGAYLYQPLNTAINATNAIKRSVTWNMTLADNATPFWFSGEIWAEILPAPPTILAPPDDQALHTAGAATGTLNVSWSNDLTADGSNPESYVVPRPRLRGARWTLQRVRHRRDLRRGSLHDHRRPEDSSRPDHDLHAGQPTVGTWYQYSLQSWFTLSGSRTNRYGAQTTRHFQVVNP